MADVKFPESKSRSNPLYLRESELRAGLELLFFAYRDFTKDPDIILEKYGFGRAHHRVIYFVGRNPGLPVADLLKILQITKQSLSRVLKQLVEDGFIEQKTGSRDRRQRLLHLTDKGRALEQELSAPQQERVAKAYREAGPEAVAGYRKVLAQLLNDEQRDDILSSIERE